ncbi:MAG: Molybdopterin synthase catalytic subunit [Chaenotheca gracillima]|nr:MAG: Molybdopterin synthase catalytic subunit [Chaenotheca gracillima]
MHNQASLEALPLELLDDIVVKLPGTEQCSLARASRQLYHTTVPHIWHTLTLEDHQGSDDVEEDHDDQQIIQILQTLKKNTYLAAKVQVLIHGCHLGPPDVFQALKRFSLKGPLFEDEYSGLGDLMPAIANLTNVHTLKIIFGHHLITTALLCGFFNTQRSNAIPVTKLWIESSSLEDVPLGDSSQCLAKLASVRLRRLPLSPEASFDPQTPLKILSRRVGELTTVNCDLNGPIQWRTAELRSNRNVDLRHGMMGARRDAAARNWRCLEDEWYPSYVDGRPAVEPSMLVSSMLNASSDTLVSLNLDWITRLREPLESFWHTLPTFPRLRSLQVRNAVMSATRFALGTQLFAPNSIFFDFIKRHRHIESLAWPLQHFFPPGEERRSSGQTEIDEVIEDLGQSLTHLRVDTTISFIGEPETDPSLSDTGVATGLHDPFTPDRHACRQKFIQRFLPKMRNLRSLKVEGGVPRDETRAIIRGLRGCPLRKLVIIGISWPLGNWDVIDNTEAPSPLLNAIAETFPDSIEVLKFCGFMGAPPIDDSQKHHRFDSIVSPLKKLKHLRYLTIAWALGTSFEHQKRDMEIVRFWTDSQDPSAMALIAPSDAEPSPWNTRLEEDFSPPALASSLCRSFEPHLAPSRKRDVELKALLLLEGAEASEIFDFSIVVRPDGSHGPTRAPRGENHPEKIQHKLQAREWF